MTEEKSTEEWSADDTKLVVRLGVWSVLGVIALAILSTTTRCTEAGSDRPHLAIAQTAETWRRLEMAAQPCDQANQRVADLLSGPQSRDNLTAAYGAAIAGSQTCTDVWVAVHAINAPKSLPDDDRRDLNKVLDDCATSYLRKGAMLQNMAQVIDGDNRISKVALVAALGATAKEETLACAENFKSIAQRQGLTL